VPLMAGEDGPHLAYQVPQAECCAEICSAWHQVRGEGIGVRDFDGGRSSGEVGEYEQLGGVVVSGERVDLFVVGEQHVE
jgi:hypothetical protein